MLKLVVKIIMKMWVGYLARNGPAQSRASDTIASTMLVLRMTE